MATIKKPRNAHERKVQQLEGKNARLSEQCAEQQDELEGLTTANRELGAERDGLKRGLDAEADKAEDLEQLLIHEYTYHALRAAELKRSLHKMGVEVCNYKP